LKLTSTIGSGPRCKGGSWAGVATKSVTSISGGRDWMSELINDAVSGRSSTTECRGVSVGGPEPATGLSMSEGSLKSSPTVDSSRCGRQNSRNPKTSARLGSRCGTTDGESNSEGWLLLSDQRGRTT
jgi:hypothetical protein